MVTHGEFMGHDPIRPTGRLWFQFSLWSLLWLAALASVFLAAFRGREESDEEDP